MFQRRTINKKKHLHEKCLRAIYNDKTLAFKELLETTGSLSIGKDSRNLQILATEVFKVLDPQIFTEIFSKRKP